MIKKIAVLITLITLFLVLSPGTLRAESTPGISSPVQAEFPGRLTFNITADSNVNVTDIRLRYSVTMAGFAESFAEIYLTFAPATKVATNWAWDMRQTGGLPPGTEIVYWWQVTDASGKTEETLPSRFIFEDTRFPWRTLTNDKINILWYEGDDAFARQLMTAAEDALTRLARDTGAAPVRPLRIYIYGSNQDYQGAFVFPTEWSGGVTFDRFDTILIGIPTNQLTWGKSTITHELTHLITGQITLNPYNNLPTWLSEGLAMYNEGLLSPGLASYLTRAIQEKSLISVQSLCDPFSAIPEQAYLSYAESFTIVGYLIGQYGQPKMLELLDSFREGSTYDGALEKAYGLNMERLNTAWQAYITRQFAPAQAKALSFAKESLPEANQGF